MAEFTSDVMKSTQEQDDPEYRKFQDLLKKQTAAAQKQFAGKYETPVAAPVSLADKMRTETAYKTGEYGRREQAAQDKYGLSQQIDTRRGGIADRVRSALFGRQQAQSELSDKMSQTQRSAGMKTQEQMQQFQTAVGKMNFYSYKSAADRQDAMRDALAKGALDFQMIDVARTQGLQMADIDRYFKTILADFDEKMKDLDTIESFKNRNALAELDAKSRSIGSIFTGLAGLAGTSSSAYREYKADTSSWAADKPSTPSYSTPNLNTTGSSAVPTYDTSGLA